MVQAEEKTLETDSSKNSEAEVVFVLGQTNHNMRTAGLKNNLSQYKWGALRRSSFDNVAFDPSEVS